MAQRPIAFLARFPSSLSRRPQRRFASDFSIQSKERIEALISGKLDETAFKSKDKHAKHATRRNPRRWPPKGRPRGKPVQELAEWGIEPMRQDTNVEQSYKNTRHDVAHPDKNSNYILPEIVQDGDDATSLPSDHKRNVREKTFRHDLVVRRSLGMNALGKPAEAIILKNPNKMKRTRKPKPLIEDEPAGPAPPLDWQSVLSQDSEISDQVWRNIEEIRPQDTTILRRRDFDKLMKRLLDGFTYEQLVTYFNNGTWDDARTVDNKPSYPWILEQSPWTAAEAEPSQWKNLTSKERRAVLILSAKWKLEIQEHIEGPGGRVLWLNPNVFKLITRWSHLVSFSKTTFTRMII